MPPGGPLAPPGEFSTTLLIAMGVLALIAAVMAGVYYVSNSRMSELAERAKQAFAREQTTVPDIQTPQSDDEQQSVESPSNRLL